mgnify:CR=1 FL=1
MTGRAATPFVTVVTPVHNGATYLAECIESVLAQTYENWEHVVIDNRSTDATPEIVERYARSDSRVRLQRHEEFVSANGNHNRAFAATAPDAAYCKVVQGDDWLYPECLERMIAVAGAHPSVGLVTAYRLVGDEVDLDGTPYTVTRLPGTAVLRQSLLGGPYVTGSPTSILLRGDLVRERAPFYDLDFLHTDTEAAYWVMARSDVGFVHQVLSFSRRQPGSRITFSDRVKTYAPENIRLLLRYGPVALAPAELRSQLWRELRRYGFFLAKQRLKPSRLVDREFQAYHRRQLAAIRAEPALDEAARRYVGALSLTLNPGREQLTDAS